MTNIFPKDCWNKRGKDMKCTCCGKECFLEKENKYPEVVFMDERNIICEECYGDFGNTTEFWVCDDVEYATWERLWL